MLVVSIPAQGVAAVFSSDHVLYFATGWRVGEPSAQNRLQLGVVYRCDPAWCLEYEEFSGKDNLPRSPLSYSHNMTAPYGKHGCTDEHLTTVRGVIYSGLPARIAETKRGFVLRTRVYEYTWERDTSQESGFILVKARGEDGKDDYEQPIGFAYESEEKTGRPISRDDLTGYFDGQIYHKNMLVRVMDEWSIKRSSIDFDKFTHSRTSTPLMEFDQPPVADIVRKYKKAFWVHHTVLPSTVVFERLTYTLHEYGHDFNGNGCFDEFGHNKMLLPVFRNGEIAALVYVEYSPDKRDGMPMISVGRYFKKP